MLLHVNLTNLVNVLEHHILIHSGSVKTMLFTQQYGR